MAISQYQKHIKLCGFQWWVQVCYSMVLIHTLTVTIGCERKTHPADSKHEVTIVNSMSFSVQILLHRNSLIWEEICWFSIIILLWLLVRGYSVLNWRVVYCMSCFEGISTRPYTCTHLSCNDTPVVHYTQWLARIYIIIIMGNIAH